MDQPHPHSPINVHCTVNRSSLIETEDGVFCTKCRKNLLDLNQPQAPEKWGRNTCGFYRTLGVTTLASAMALAGCEDKKHDVIRIGEVSSPQQDSAMRIGKVQKPHAEYPVAKYAPGREDRVISPNAGKEIDVRDIPGCHLVMDPYFNMVAPHHRIHCKTNKDPDRPAIDWR